MTAVGSSFCHDAFKCKDNAQKPRQVRFPSFPFKNQRMSKGPLEIQRMLCTECPSGSLPEGLFPHCDIGNMFLFWLLRDKRFLKPGIKNHKGLNHVHSSSKQNINARCAQIKGSTVLTCSQM